MAHYMREHMQRQVWEAWHEGRSMAQITRLLPTNRTSIRTLISSQGGIRPPPRRRSSRALSAAEREWIGEGLAAGCSLRMIARPETPLRTTSLAHLGSRGRDAQAQTLHTCEPNAGVFL